MNVFTSLLTAVELVVAASTADMSDAEFARRVLEVTHIGAETKSTIAQLEAQGLDCNPVVARAAPEQGSEIQEQIDVFACEVELLHERGCVQRVQFYSRVGKIVRTELFFEELPAMRSASGACGR